jgi:hypothetical protein
MVHSKPTEVVCQYRDLLRSRADLNCSEYQLYGLMLLFHCDPGLFHPDHLGMPFLHFAKYISSGLCPDEGYLHCLQEQTRPPAVPAADLFRYLSAHAAYLAPPSLLAGVHSVDCLRYALSMSLLENWDYRTICTAWCLSLSVATRTKLPLRYLRDHRAVITSIYPNFPLTLFQGIGRASVQKLGAQTVGELPSIGLRRPAHMRTRTWELLHEV